jgi:hypothetical protein
VSHCAPTRSASDRIRALRTRVAVASSDLAWTVPAALHRASGGRWFSGFPLYRAEIVPARLRDTFLPGMTSPSERAYFTWHARELVTGAGALVDLGSWLGSTTAALAIGLRANRSDAASRTRIHAYDRFLWEPWMDVYAGLVAGGAPAPGASFVTAFEATRRVLA